MKTNNFLYYIMGSALIISSIVWGCFYYFAQSSGGKDVLSVTGSSKQRVTSDQAKITLSIMRTVPVSSLASGNASISRDFNLLKKMLLEKGIPEKDIVSTPVYMDQVWDSNQNAEIRYNLRQNAVVQSTDIEKITNISKAVPALVSQGAIISVQSLEYLYSKLPELRVSLLSSAIKDAKARANSIAESTGRNVGGIRSASSGVVQVLPANSVEISDYGTYDTSSIEKDIMVTVKAVFGLN